MRRRTAVLLALGLLLTAAPPAVAQAQTTTAPSPSPSSAATTAAPVRQTIAPAGGSGGLPTAGEGFPWIPAGIGILLAGLIGSRLRRASRR